MPTMIRFMILAVGMMSTCVSKSHGQDRLPAIDFERQLKPILLKHCINCHGPNRQESDLALHTREAFFAGGAGGKDLQSAEAALSSIVTRIHATDDSQMPPREIVSRRHQPSEPCSRLGLSKVPIGLNRSPTSLTNQQPPSLPQPLGGVCNRSRFRPFPRLTTRRVGAEMKSIGSFSQNCSGKDCHPRPKPIAERWPADCTPI